MTYWATLWYAGAVVFQLGYEGQTLDKCELLINVIQTDITNTYNDPEKIYELSQSPFPTNQFTVSCEIEVLLTGKEYVK